MSYNLRLKAQALLELAIFGAIIIMLLGVLVSYGLRYNFQQQVMQEAFRKALKSASGTNLENTPISVSHAVIRDRHIPNPSSPFGIGSVAPMSSSASVVRNFAMSDTPDTLDALPRLAIDIEGGKCPGSKFSPEGSDPPCYYLTAGFREEKNIDPASRDKYNEIYGANNVWKTGDGECLAEDPDFNSGTPACISRGQNIKIIDSSAGEIMDYDSTVRQCRQIVDVGFCTEECERGKSPGSTTNCNAVCSQVMNPPNQQPDQKSYVPAIGGAWYCADYKHDDANDPTGAKHTYIFPVLNQLFSLSGLKNMGLQQDYKQLTKTNTSLRKTEDASGIATTDNINWNTLTTRRIIYRTYGDESENAHKKEVTSDVGQNKEEERRVAW